MDTPETTHDLDLPDATPVPPRYWWLRRILIGTGVLLVGLVGVRIWWGWEAHRRLTAQIDKYVAAGEPIYPEDFDPEPVPDELNAAKLLQEAERALNLTLDQSVLISDLSGDPWSANEHLDEMAQVVSANAEILDLLRRARDLPGADWGIRIRSPALNTMMPILSGQRMLAKLLVATANYHHATGDDQAAVDTLLTLWRHGATIDKHPTLINHLVTLAIYSLLTRSIEAMVADLGVEPTADGVGRGASRALEAQVRMLVVAMLDETNLRNATVRGMLAERMLQLDLVQISLRGEMSLPTLGPFGRVVQLSLAARLLSYPTTPLLKLDGLRTLRNMDAFAAAASQETWPQAEASFPYTGTADSTLDLAIRPWSKMLLGSIERFTYWHFGMLPMTRMAATALAIRLYELDRGSRPATLADLVPEYLTEVPRDPLADGDRPIAYTPDGPSPMLYSVGRDGVDDGGAHHFYPGGKVHRNSLDMPFFLDGKRPSEDKPPPESAETGEDDEDGEDERGDGE